MRLTHIRCSFRTGHKSIRDSNTEVLGEDVMSKVGPVYGLNAEGELNRCFRPSGHPGVRHIFLLRAA